MFVFTVLGVPVIMFPIFAKAMMRVVNKRILSQRAPVAEKEQ